MKKNLKIAAVVMAVSVLSVNVFGNGIRFYAGQPEQEISDAAGETDGEWQENMPGGIQKGGEDSQENGSGIQENTGDIQEGTGTPPESSGDGDRIQENPEDSRESMDVTPENSGDENKSQENSGNGEDIQGNGEDSVQQNDGDSQESPDGNIIQKRDGDTHKNALDQAMEQSFSEIIGEYDMYAMLSNGKDFPIRSMPEEGAEVLHTLPSGYQVKLTGAVVKNGAIWFQVEYGFQDVACHGFIQEQYVITQDTRLQDWKESIQSPRTYGIDKSVRAAAGNTDLSAFPKSYQSYIKSLTAAHPNWTFVPMNTGLDWKEVLKNENADSVNLVDNSDPATMVTWKSTNASSYNLSTGKWVIKEGSTWVQASESIIKYYMDPRNFLNEDSVFQFEQLTYNSAYHTEAGVEKVLSGTFMSHAKLEDGSGGGITYAQAFMQIGQELKVSPFFLASRVRQEQGVSGNSSLISGTYPGYKGYYNYFNRQATGIGEAVIINGLKEAKSKGWNTRYKALKGGAESVSADYITKGQDTFYLQKFDVDASYNGLYWHQYMQNLLAADHEGMSVRKSYTEMGTINNSFVFKVPVYNNMPSTACGKPGATLAKPSLSVSKSGDTSVKLSWKEIPGAEAYQIFRKEKNGSYTRIKTVTGLENVSYQDTKAVPGKLYYYKIRAYLKLYGGNLRSSNSAEKTADLRTVKPTWKSIKVTNYARATLSWNGEDVTGYRIYRKTDNGAYKCLKTIKTPSTTSFKDTTIQPGHTYSYRMRCYRKINGKSYFSYYSKVKTIKVAMSAASLNKAAVSGGSKVKLSWAPDAKAQGYQIFRSDSANGKFTRVKSISNPAKSSWSDTSVAGGKKYYYKIRTYIKTVQGTATSSYSNVLSVNTTLQKPVLKAVKSVSAGIKATWKKASNATGYKVYRSTSKNGPYQQVKRIAANGTVAWTDKNVSKGKTYYYKIKSFSLYNGKGKHSAFSDALSVKF